MTLKEAEQVSKLIYMSSKWSINCTQNKKYLGTIVFIYSKN